MRWMWSVCTEKSTTRKKDLLAAAMARWMAAKTSGDRNDARPG
jgi:hypothetical protein